MIIFIHTHKRIYIFESHSHAQSGQTDIIKYNDNGDHRMSCE